MIAPTPKRKRKFNELQKSLISLLFNFVNSDMPVQEYLTRGKKKKNAIMKNYSEVIKTKDLGIHFKHEKEHQKAWRRFGVTAEFRRDINGAVFTTDTDFDKKAIHMPKGKVLEIFKKVCLAAYKSGEPFNACKSDIIQYEILSQKQLKFPLSQTDIMNIKNKYDKN